MLKNKILLQLIIVLFVTISIIALLMNFSDKPNKSKNGFHRNWISVNLNLLNKTKIESAPFDICGKGKKNFFLSGEDPRKIYVMNHDLNKTDTLNIPMPINSDIMLGYDIIVDSPEIEMYVRNSSIAVRHFIGDTFSNVIKLPTPLYTRMAKLSDSFIVLRAFNENKREQFLKLINLNTGEIKKTVPFLNSKEDAGLSSDGMLKYDKQTGKLIYVQYYTNQFYCLDTNLNLLYASNTIDTINNASIPVHKIAYENMKQKSSVSPSVPLRPINTKSYADNNYLFNVSSLKADNENLNYFNNNTVVDVYKITSGKYFGSFYIPNIENKKVKRFKIYNDTLITIYPQYIALYKIKEFR